MSFKSHRQTANFYLNGQWVEVGGQTAGMMLADYLRLERRLTGTKIVCAEGDCGACTVLIRRPGEEAFLPVNACILLTAQADGASVVSIEGLKNAEDENNLTPVQKAMVECNGSQCGFCTPGFVMALTGLVEKKLACGEKTGALCSKKEAMNALTGNLCRCTGYQPILDAAQAVPLDKTESLNKQYFTSAIIKTLQKSARRPLWIEGVVYAPLRLAEAARFLLKEKEARVLGSGTDLGVQVNKQKIEPKTWVSLHLISKLNEIAKSKGTKRKSARLRVGARVNLSALRSTVKEDFKELAQFLNIFASPQIKNVATLAGNLANASPIGDTLPMLLACDATVFVTGPRRTRAIPIDRFFLGYRKTALKRGELIQSIEFDLPQPEQRIRLTKISQRRDLDISTVVTAFRAEVHAQTALKNLRLAMGGIAATPVRLKKTENFLATHPLSSKTVTQALKVLESEIKPISDLRGSAEFRKMVSKNVLRAFLETVVL